MTVIDPEFEGVGQTAGILIWRIEDFNVKKVPQREYGNFYIGDSYIVLSTVEFENQRLQWDIHFWLGDETTQDEAGTAAIKSVELDDVLGGAPVQHREVQGHESSLFLSYFKKGIRYLQGGVKSGFHHVEQQVDIKRLLRVKGRRNVRLHQMPAEIGSMNSGDCFILDRGQTVFIYVGSGSGRMERIKAIQAANAIRDDVHCGRSTVKIIDASSSGSEVQEFFEELGGGSPADIPDAAAGGDDDSAFEASFETQLALYKIWEDDSGALQVELISEKPLKQEQLHSDDCFLLDGGLNGIFVWIGKGSSSKERAGAMQLADKYITKKSYPKWLPVKRVIDGGEPPLFKSYFTEWKDEHDSGPKRARLFKLSNQTGKLKVEEICNFTQEDLSLDDVMVLDAGGDIFIWIGNGADSEEREASQSLVENYVHSDPTSRTASSVEIKTINQGDEPDSFMTHFGAWNADMWQNLSKI